MRAPPSLSYDEAVCLLRNDETQTELVRASYLDEDIHAAAQRFELSDEWQEVQSWLRKRNIQAPAQVLDLACGNGIASLAFAKLGFEVFALDPNTGKHSGLSVLQDALTSFPSPPVHLVEGIAENIPLESSSLDLVYLRQAAHHFQDLQQGLRESFRVLRPGGYCFMTREHVVRNAQEREEFLSGHPLHAYHGGEWAYTVEEYEGALKQAGFSSIEHFGTYCSPINFAPLKKEDLQSWLRRGLQRRFGNYIGDRLAQWKWIFRAYQGFLESRCHYPGRMYSFVAKKPL